MYIDRKNCLGFSINILMVSFNGILFILLIMYPQYRIFRDWGLASAMCLNSNGCCFSTRCSKVIEQERLISELRKQISELKKIDECNSFKDILIQSQKYILQYRMKYDDDTDEPNMIWTYVEPKLTEEMITDKEKLMFYTVTFSPQRFHLHLDNQYIDYILFHISELYERQIISFAYGCFERHKSGIIHSHIIIKAYQQDIVKEYLNKKFNHDARNRRCIDSSFVKSISKTIDYIHKESSNSDYPYFSIGSFDCLKQVSNKDKTVSSFS